MPTADRRPFVAQAIRCFPAQDYAEKELVIVDDGADAVADLVPDDSRVRYFQQEARRLVGAKRNFGCHELRCGISFAGIIPTRTNEDRFDNRAVELSGFAIRRREAPEEALR